MSNAKQGVWTPTAAVLCFECHGNVLKRVDYVDGKFTDRQLSDEKFESLNTPRELDEYEEITKCDKCGQDIIVAKDIALEHNMVLTLKKLGYDANMEQTGGMCNAASVIRSKELHTMIKYEDKWYVGTFKSIYDEEGQLVDEEWLEGEDCEFDTAHEVLDYIKETNHMKESELNGEQA